MIPSGPLMKCDAPSKSFGDFQAGVRSASPGSPTEEQRTPREANQMPPEIITEDLRTELAGDNSTRLPDPYLLAAPGNLGMSEAHHLLDEYVTCSDC